LAAVTSGEATNPASLAQQVAQYRPDVVVMDDGIGVTAGAMGRKRAPPAQPVQARHRPQPVDDDDIGVRQRLKTLECQQLRIPRTAPDQDHPARAGCLRATLTEPSRILAQGRLHRRDCRITQGRSGLIGLLGALQREPEQEHVGPTSLGDALRRTGAIARQRGIVVIVSDFRGPLDWRKPLLELMSRHEVLAVEIRDLREQELPDIGELWLVDPETGRQIRVDTRSASLRERFAVAAAEERTGVARVLSALGVPQVVLSTSGDWLRAYAGFLGARR